MRYPLVMATTAATAVRLLPIAALALLAVPAAAQVTVTAPPAGGSSEVPGALTKLQPTQLRASKLIGAAVYGAGNQSIGDVADLIIDRDSRVSAVVISLGGFLGIGDKRVAVPMEDVKFGENDRLTVNLTRDQFAQAPAYSYGDRDLARSGSSGGAGSPGFGAAGAGGAAGAPGPR